MIVVGMAGVAAGIGVCQRIEDDADMRGFFVLRLIVAAVAAPAALFASVNRVPFTLINNRMRGGVAGAAGRLCLVEAPLRADEPLL